MALGQHLRPDFTVAGSQHQRLLGRVVAQDLDMVVIQALADEGHHAFEEAVQIGGGGDFLGDLGGNFDLVTALLQRAARLGLQRFAAGDVCHQPQHTNGGAVRAGEEQAAVADPQVFTVFTAVAVFDVVIGQALLGGVEGIQGGGAVVRVDEIDPLINPAGHFGQAEAEELLDAG